jgi:hypothetical protein
MAAMRKLIVILVTALTFAPHPGPIAPSEIRFEEIAARSGLNFTTASSPTPNKNQIETMVAGVARRISREWRCHPLAQEGITLLLEPFVSQ